MDAMGAERTTAALLRGSARGGPPSRASRRASRSTRAGGARPRLAGPKETDANANAGGNDRFSPTRTRLPRTTPPRPQRLSRRLRTRRPPPPPPPPPQPRNQNRTRNRNFAFLGVRPGSRTSPTPRCTRRWRSSPVGLVRTPGALHALVADRVAALRDAASDAHLTPDETFESADRSGHRSGGRAHHHWVRGACARAAAINETLRGAADAAEEAEARLEAVRCRGARRRRTRVDVDRRSLGPGRGEPRGASRAGRVRRVPRRLADRERRRRAPGAKTNTNTNTNTNATAQTDDASRGRRSARGAAASRRSWSSARAARRARGPRALGAAVRGGPRDAVPSAGEARQRRRGRPRLREGRARGARRGGRQADDGRRPPSLLSRDDGQKCRPRRPRRASSGGQLRLRRGRAGSASPPPRPPPDGACVFRGVPERDGRGVRGREPRSSARVRRDRAAGDGGSREGPGLRSNPRPAAPGVSPRRGGGGGRRGAVRVAGGSCAIDETKPIRDAPAEAEEISSRGRDDDSRRRRRGV